MKNKSILISLKILMNYYLREHILNYKLKITIKHKGKKV